MRRLRLVLPALAFVVSVAWVTQVLACEKDKATAAASNSATCTAEMAAKCTPAMMAACKAKGAKASAVTASASKSEACSAEMMAACKARSASAAAAHCPGMMGVAMVASSDRCAGKSATTTASSDHCAGMGAATAVTAGAGDAGRGQAAAIAAGSGQCSGHANLSSKLAHGDCDACADMAQCEQELSDAAVRTQIVPLKNGVMFVYTAENRGKVNAVQSAMARRTEHLNQIITAGDKARLCPDCKSMRGAMASGKLNREVINIEGGALTLMTSSDPAMVAKIHAMVDANRLVARKS